MDLVVLDFPSPIDQVLLILRLEPGNRDVITGEGANCPF